MEKRWIVVSGDCVSGFTFYGPYSKEEAEEIAADDANYNRIVELSGYAMSSDR